MHTPAGLGGDPSVLWIGTPFTAFERSFWTGLEGHDPGGVKDRTACTWWAPLASVDCCRAHVSSSPPLAS